MKLIVGLGNPGFIYANTRHNIGFAVVKAVARGQKSSFKKEKGVAALSAAIKLGADKALLALPLTFMNLSGIAAAELLKKHAAAPEDLLVVCDDFDLEFGRMRIRAKGSSGGHRGLQSLISQLKSNNFCRLRIGIGRPDQEAGAADYVLSRFNPREKRALKTTIEKAVVCCRVWIRSGITSAMNSFNRNA